MNYTILKNTKKEIIILLSCMLISSATLIFFHSFMTSSLNKNLAATSQLKHARESYYDAVINKALLEKYEPHYNKLKNTGIIGNEHRLNWINNIDNIALKYNISHLRYKIDKRQNISTEELSIKYPDIKIYKSAMTLQMQLLHEGDLYTILSNINNNPFGLFDIQTCTIQRNNHLAELNLKNNRNFSASCLLYWYTFQPPGEII